MKISFTCNNIGTGGAERVICALANKMATDGHLINIICYEKLPSFYYKLENNVSVIELDSKKNSRSSIILRKIAGIIDLYKLYKKIQGSDKVISFYTRQNCYSILVCKILSIPIICSERDHFFTCDSKVNHILRTIFYPHADGFIHQTKIARDYLRLNEGVCCKDIVVPNPLWIDNFPNYNPIRGKIVAVGRLAEQKNYEEMLDIFALIHKKNPKAFLVIYGDGDAKKYYNLCDELGISDSVQFAGMTTDVLSVYAEAEVFIMTSLGEGYPNALMEALSIGVPSVSYDCPVGGPRDMIHDGINGYLIPQGNKELFANRVYEILEDNFLQSKFSSNAISIRKSNDFEEIYKKIMDFIFSVN